MSKRKDGQFIYDEFVKRGYEPLFKPQDYINNLIKLPYICPKHKEKGIQYQNWTNLQSDKGCWYCGYDKRKGDKCWNWQGGKTEEGIIIRQGVDYKQWRNKVFERDNYTCQCCGDNSGHNLQAHHIENFHDNGELRFNVDNGMTLCKACHDFSYKGSFHHMYGTKKNTKQQLIEYLKIRKGGD